MHGHTQNTHKTHTNLCVFHFTHVHVHACVRAYTHTHTHIYTCTNVYLGEACEPETMVYDAATGTFPLIIFVF